MDILDFYHYFIVIFKGLKLLLNAVDNTIVDVDRMIESKTDVSWLITNLPQLPNFPAFKSQVS